MEMYRANQPQAAPPYPGPPLDYKGGPYQPQAFPQQGGYPQSSPYPPPHRGYQPGNPFASPQAAPIGTTGNQYALPQAAPIRTTGNPYASPQAAPIRTTGYPFASPQAAPIRTTTTGYPYASPHTTPINSAVAQAMANTLLRDDPGHATCPHCLQTVITETKFVSGRSTWVNCLIFGIFGCWICCFIPFCINSCKDVEHRCPNCDEVIYLHERQ